MLSRVNRKMCSGLVGDPKKVYPLVFETLTPAYPQRGEEVKRLSRIHPGGRLCTSRQIDKN